MEITEDKLKLALASDLIIFMAHAFTQGRENQVAIINELMNKWSERIETSANIMKEQVASQISEQSEETPKDVAMILLDVTNLHNKTVKGEFKTEIREIIFKGLTAYSSK